MIDIILLSAALFLILATLLPLIPKDNWWIRSFDFPRLQLFYGILLILLAYLTLKNSYVTAEKGIIISLVLCLSYQIYMIYPFTFFAAMQVQQNHKQGNDPLSISLLCTNVQMTNRSSSKLKEIIRTYDPDIFLAIETMTGGYKNCKSLKKTTRPP